MEHTEALTFQIYHNQELEFQLEDGLVTLFGLNGISQIFTGEKNYELARAGILVINPMELYQVTCPNDAVILCLHINKTILHTAGWQHARYCSCYARDKSSDDDQMITLRQHLAGVFQEYLQNHSASTEFQSPLMNFLYLLQEKYVVAFRTQSQRQSTMNRIKHILDEIHEHRNEDISLSEIAGKEYLSVSYLSRFFQKNLHMTFSQYMIHLRLIHSVQMLTQTDESITRIAYDCGFKSPSAFIETFKKSHGQTPGQFREIKQELRKLQATGLPQNSLRSDVSALLDYAPEEKTEELPEEKRQIFFRCKDEPVMKKPRRTLLNIGYARDGLLAPIQQQIMRAQKEIGFDFIRFHGLFDQDMRIYQEDTQGNPFFHFSYADMLFDFLLEQKLIPYVELSFMPEQLAVEQMKIFDRPSIISGCRNLDKWGLLIRKTLEHFIARYGLETVRTWRFTTISQSYVHLGCVNWEDYQNLYLTTWKSVKTVDPQLKFGGPGCFPEMMDNEEFGVAAFLRFVMDGKCIPDFIALQCYPHVQTYDPLFMNYTLSQQSSPAILSEDRDFVLHTIEHLKKLLTDYGMKGKELFLEECSSTLWQRDLSSETCYKAVWIAKNACDSMQDAVFGYWLLTDLIEERAVMESVFHGGYGLFTYNGIPKAGYQSMRLVAALGNQILRKGDGWVIARDENSVQILLYNYCHYSNIYRYRYQRLKKPADAYSVFETGKKLHFQIIAEDITDGPVVIEQSSVTREQGSAFDRWLQMGAPAELKKEELNYLIRTADPATRQIAVPVQGCLCLDVQLNPLDTVLLRFSLPAQCQYKEKMT